MKLFLIKKGILYFCVLLSIFSIILGVTCATAIRIETSKSYVATILIDAGHGGIDAGVRGISSNVKESTLNLQIAKHLRAYFVNGGFKVVMTRTHEGGLYGLPTKGFKMRDMKERKDIIEQASPDMIISIHQNFCSIPQKRGGTAFFNENNATSIALASAIQPKLNELYNLDRDNFTLKGDYYILRCHDCPSIIVECGFLSNEEDEKLLLNEQFKSSLAYAIFVGAISYFG